MCVGPGLREDGDEGHASLPRALTPSHSVDVSLEIYLSLFPYSQKEDSSSRPPPEDAEE